MSTFLFLFTFALPATGATARVDLSAVAQLDVASANQIRSQFGPLDWNRLGGGGSFGATIFLGRPLVDDEAPLTAQPFLQRKTTLSLSGGGAQLSLDWSQAGTTLIHRDFRNGVVSASVSGYARWLYLSANVGYRNESWQDHSLPGAGVGPRQGPSMTEAELPLGATLGGRIADTLIYAGWGVTVMSQGSSSAPSQVPFWGGAVVGVRSVIRRRLSLVAFVRVLDGGASVSALAELFFARRLGLYLGVSGGASSLPGESPTSRQSFAGGVAGVALWVTRHVKLDLAYAPSWDQPSSGSATIDHLLTFTLAARL